MDRDDYFRPPDNGWLYDNYDELSNMEATEGASLHENNMLLYAPLQHTSTITNSDDWGNKKPAAKPNQQTISSNFAQLTSPHDVANTNIEMGGPPKPVSSVHFREDSNKAGRISSTSSFKQSKLPAQSAKAMGKGKVARTSQLTKHQPAAAKGPIRDTLTFLDPRYAKVGSKKSFFNPYAKSRKQATDAMSAPLKNIYTTPAADHALLASTDATSVHDIDNLAVGARPGSREEEEAMFEAAKAASLDNLAVGARPDSHEEEEEMLEAAVKASLDDHAMSTKVVPAASTKKVRVPNTPAKALPAYGKKSSSVTSNGTTKKTPSFIPYAKDKKPPSTAGKGSSGNITQNAILPSSTTPKRMLRSKKKYVNPDEIPNKPDHFTGTNKSLLQDVFMFDMDKVNAEIASYTSQKSSTGGSSHLTSNAATAFANSIAEMSSRIDIQGQQIRLPLWDNKRGAPRMCEAVDKQKVVYNPFALCKCCRKKPARTCTPFKAGDEEGPGTHPPELCFECAPMVLGNDYLRNPGSCHCGKDKHRHYSVCTDCRKASPCIVDGCLYDGSVNPNTLRCPKHQNESWNRFAESHQEIQSCIRCGEELLFHRIQGAHGVAKNVCTRCSSKCLRKLDDGSWCSKDREEGRSCYCGPCFGEKEKERKREYNAAKRNGTFVPARWTDGEVNELTGLLKKYKGTVSKAMIAEFRQSHPTYTATAVKSKAKKVRKELNNKQG